MPWRTYQRYVMLPRPASRLHFNKVYVLVLSCRKRSTRLYIGLLRSFPTRDLALPEFMACSFFVEEDPDLWSGFPWHAAFSGEHPSKAVENQHTALDGWDLEMSLFQRRRSGSHERPPLTFVSRGGFVRLLATNMDALRFH